MDGNDGWGPRIKNANFMSAPEFQSYRDMFVDKAQTMIKAATSLAIESPLSVAIKIDRV